MVDSESLKTFGSFLRRKRMMAFVKQTDLAKHLSRTPQFISNIERGVAPPPYTLLPKWLEYIQTSKEEWIQMELKIKRDELEKIFFKHK